MANWKNEPLNIVQDIFEKSNGTEWIKQVTSFFREKMTNKNEFCSIPSLNSCKSEYLKPNSLVRYRGIIQDMYNPEFYLGVYEIHDKKSNQVSTACGGFRDVIQCEPHIEINVDSSRNVTLERMSYYCVPVPGENSWVKKCTSGHGDLPAHVFEQKMKREHEECSSANSNNILGIGADILASGGDMSEAIGVEVSDEIQQHNKKTRTRDDSSPSGVHQTRGGSGAISSADNSFLNPDGMACIVKIYDEEETYSLNDCVEFVGILSTDPALAYLNDREDGSQSAFVNSEEVMAQEQEEEDQTHCPPPSLVPRLHVILSYKMKHTNPLIADPAYPCNTTEEAKEDFDAVIAQAQATRRHLHAILEQALFGDSLAADYLICHLISSVYIRSGVTAIGKFCLNLSKLPVYPENNYVQLLFQLIQEITTKTCLLPLTIGNLNSANLVPKKDYKTNKLTTGVLQLSQHSHLIVDETGMTTGQLESQGVRNMAALENLISWQKVDYDFGFNVMEYTANVAVLVLSEGKSLLCSDCHVPLRPLKTLVDKASDQFAAIATYLTPSLLDEIRRYITVANLMDCTIPRDLQKSIEDDFVESRRFGSNGMTADDLHNLLLLARLVSVSEGQTELTQDTWERARRMDAERKIRLN